MESLIKHINKTIIAPFLGAKDGNGNELHYKAVLFNQDDIKTAEISSKLDTYNGKDAVVFKVPATEIDKFNVGDKVGLSIYPESHDEVWYNMFVYTVNDVRVVHATNKESVVSAGSNNETSMEGGTTPVNPGTIGGVQIQ